DYVNAHTNLGSAYQERGQLDEAAACFEQALCLKPEAASPRWNRALLRLLQGHFANAWSDYEARWQLPGKVQRHVDRPRWDGAPLQGKTILLYAEQGLGDTLQFIRYAPLVQQRGGRV